MSGQARGLRKRSASCYQGRGGFTDVGEPLATAFMLASVRLLTGVGTDVNGQGTALDEALVAITPGTDVRTVIGVYAIVPDEVRLAIELLQVIGNQVSMRI